MNVHHTLTRHRDIQAWVTARKGLPAMIRDRSDLGHQQARLALRFDGPGRPEGLPTVDQEASPIGWAAWLAELDRQQLALRVGEDGHDYALVERASLH